MFILIILIIVISFSLDNLATAIRESSSSNSNNGIINELYRFNNNFEKYLQTIQNEKSN